MINATSSQKQTVARVTSEFRAAFNDGENAAGELKAGVQAAWIRVLTPEQRK
jgi:hypothetical protein